MPNNPRIKWNMGAFQQIRRLDSVDAMLEDIVKHILDELGEGYEGDVRAGRTRSRGSVVTATVEAIIDNHTNDSLLRALARQRVGL
jgi:hypothetical protein